MIWNKRQFKDAFKQYSKVQGFYKSNNSCRNFLRDFNFKNYLLITHLHIVTILNPYIWFLKSSEHFRQRDRFLYFK